jgi:hypothetical protein
MLLACCCALMVQLLHASAAWLLPHHHVQATSTASGHAWGVAKAICLSRLLLKGCPQRDLVWMVTPDNIAPL